MIRRESFSSYSSGSYEEGAQRRAQRTNLPALSTDRRNANAIVSTTAAAGVAADGRVRGPGGSGQGREQTRQAGAAVGGLPFSGSASAMESSPMPTSPSRSPEPSSSGAEGVERVR
jgi:hypothetical protein